MGRIKKLLRRVTPLRTSTFLYHHDADVLKIGEQIGTARSTLDEVRAVGDDLRKALVESRASRREARAAQDETLSQLKAMSVRLDALEGSQDRLRSEIMRNQWLLNDARRKQDEYLDPELYAHALCLWYHRVTGRVLDLANPRTFNEKVQWAKVYDRDPRRARLADKVAVRDYVRERVGERYLVPLLGTWRSASEIDFESLPDSFVLKANHGCGYNAIVRDKASEDLGALRRRADTWMREEFAFRNGFEMQYQGIERRLFAEQYIDDIDMEYQAWCFEGNPAFISVIDDPHGKNAKSSYSIDWEKLNFVTSLPRLEEDVEKPTFLKDFLKLIGLLSEGIPFVRLDFYITESSRIYFSEATFTSASGLVHWDPPETDMAMGDLYHLP